MRIPFIQRFYIAFLLGLAAISPTAAYAHGTGCRVPQNKPASLEFYYSTGDRMAYQEARVYSPKDEKISFQSGRTDEHGRFAFTPDVPGTWRVAVKDSEGHLAEAVLDVPEDFFNTGEGSAARVKSGTPEGFELFLRAGLGVSVLFNAAAFTLLHRRVKKG